MVDILKISEEKYGQDLFDIMKELLLTPKETLALSDEKFKYYEENGFVIGKHDVETYEKWIKSSKNDIIIAKEGKKVVGFCIILGTDDIIKKVQNYGKDIKFLDENAQKIIDSGKFKYLIQIGVSRNSENNGLGSKILNSTFNNCKFPMISFVVKNPIINNPSLYIHLKMGFDVFGIYYGEYDEFKDYQSFGLIHLPDSKVKNKSQIKKIIELHI